MILAPLLLAAATPADPVLDKCIDEAEYQQAYGMCYGAAIERADTALNARWKRLRALTSEDTAEEKQNLLDEQRAWIVFKEKACNFYWGWGGNYGSMHRTVIGPSCKLQVINERIADLDGMIASLEPDEPDNSTDSGSPKE